MKFVRHPAQHPSLQIAGINRAAARERSHSSYRFLYSDVLSAAQRFHGGDRIHVNRKSNRRKVARNVARNEKGHPARLFFLGSDFDRTDFDLCAF